MATRIAYAFILLINSIVSWIMLTPWALKKLQNMTLDYMEIKCDGKECHGWVAVHRINFALGLFHLILAFMLLGVRSTRNGRAALQNGFWGPKVVLWVLLVVASFFIPEQFFFVYGTYIAFLCAMLFLLLGLILLVDLAHSWAELCLQKIEDSGSGLWRGLLIGSTVGMYVSSLVMTILMYIFFARSQCHMNQAAITVRALTHSSPFKHRPVADVPDQSGCVLNYLLRVGSTRRPGGQPPGGIGPGRNGDCLLHILDHVGRVYGTG